MLVMKGANKRQVCDKARLYTDGAYYCSRTLGHDGPCAAHLNMVVGHTPREIIQQALAYACDKGEISEHDEDKANKWMEWRFGYEGT